MSELIQFVGTIAVIATGVYIMGCFSIREVINAR